MRENSQIRVAITYHYSLSFGGSERVLEVLAGMYPEADFFALLVDRAALPAALHGRKITTSFLDRLPGGKRFYRHLLPLYPLAVECLDLSGYDLVISADGAATKGVLTDQDAIHFCYCHSPPRSYWDQYAANRRTMPWWMRAIFAPVSQYMRQWDFAAAQRIDGFISNSEYVAERVSKYYRRESTVIYPPVDVGRVDGCATAVADRHDKSYLSVGRLVSSKRVDLAVGACNRLGRRLQIAGTGPEERALRSLAGPTVEFLGRVSEEELQAKYSACRALLFPADEDFGIVSIEAQAHGRPVIAYGRGGSLETVRGAWAEQLGGDLALSDIGKSEGFRANKSYTGLFFSEQTSTSLAEAILQFERIEPCFDPRAIQRHARQFDTKVFVERMYSYVEDQMKCRRRRGSLAARAEWPGFPREAVLLANSESAFGCNESLEVHRAPPHNW